MDKPITGGCLCGALRYEANAAPTFMGYCCCDDCQKASGSGFIPFVGFVGAMAIMTKFKPDWVILPKGLQIFEGMPR